MKNHSYKCGEIVCADGKNGLKIAAGDGIITIERLKWPGKQEMAAADFLRGHSIEKGYLFEENK